MKCVQTSGLDLNSEHRNKVHRISAQKSLNMQPSYSPSAIDQARAGLLYGYEQGEFAHKIGHRWGGNPSTHLLNDFDRLMVYLFSEDYDKSVRYRREEQDTENQLYTPATKLK